MQGIWVEVPGMWEWVENARNQGRNVENRVKQRVKVSSPYSIWKDIFYGVLQSSIFEHLLFNIHLCENLFTTQNFHCFKCYGLEIFRAHSNKKLREGNVAQVAQNFAWHFLSLKCITFCWKSLYFLVILFSK